MRLTCRGRRRSRQQFSSLSQLVQRPRQGWALCDLHDDDCDDG